MNILFVGILGIDLKYTFWEMWEVIWVDYYFTGPFCDVAAWRWQIMLLFISFLIALTTPKG
jgi:hypothetical protein